MTRSRAVYHNQHAGDSIPTLKVEGSTQPPTGSAISKDRDSSGRFAPGNSVIRSRYTLDGVLKLKVDAWTMADNLIDLCLNHEHAPETRLKALSYVYDRLSGRPKLSVAVSSDDSAGVIAMRQLYAAISGTEYVPPPIEGDYTVAEPASETPHI